MKKYNPTETYAWKKLNEHYNSLKNVHMRTLFSIDKNRFENFSVHFNNIFFDYSKNIIIDDTMKLLFELAGEVDLSEAISSLFSGERINETENRSVLHTALRNFSKNPIIIDGIDIMPAIKNVLTQMRNFTEKIRNGEWKGYSGKPITDIVNIGIGGSDLGPKMVTEALKYYGADNIRVYFVSNIDATHIVETLKNLKPDTTLFIISSKSFLTKETIANAKTAKDWFLSSSKDTKSIAKHFIAISTNAKKVKEFGIDNKNLFRLWDFVGGRFSLWGAIGLSIACYIGFDNYLDLLEGAYEMDIHFQTEPINKNIPIIIALIGIWYNNFFNAETEALFFYDQYLHKFPEYLQQANMESNGKNVSRCKKEVTYQTCPVIWGDTGSNSQHSFFQLLHQGTKLIPTTFFAPVIPLNNINEHHNILLSNFFAQTESLMRGKTAEEAKSELESKGFEIKDIKNILPFKVFKGNNPSNSILYKKLTPKVLGSLIAMYEHKIFVQGVIWNIFSFDQWGVEYGKNLADKILIELQKQIPTFDHDNSTNGLMNIYSKMKNSELKVL